MLYTIAVILLILWLLGFVSGYTIGAFIHVLLSRGLPDPEIGASRTGRRIIQPLTQCHDAISSRNLLEAFD